MINNSLKYLLGGVKYIGIFFGVGLLLFITNMTIDLSFTFVGLAVFRLFIYIASIWFFLHLAKTKFHLNVKSDAELAEQKKRKKRIVCELIALFIFVEFVISNMGEIA